MSVAAIPLSQGPRVRVVLTGETTKGVTPANAAWNTLRLINRDIDMEKTILVSKEVRSDRQIADVRHGFQKVTGKLTSEWSLSNQDTLIQSAMSGTWTPFVTASITQSATNVHTFTRSTGSYITDGIRPGDIIQCTGFVNAANNAPLRVVSVIALAVTVDDAVTPLVVESTVASTTMAVIGNRIDIGVTQQTFSMERQFLDLLIYQYFAGCTVDQWDVKAEAEQIVTSDFTMLGLKPVSFGSTTQTTIGSATLVAAATHSPFDSFSGTIYAGGALIGVITSVDFSLKNGRALSGVVGSKYSPDIFEGNANVTGNLSAFLLDPSLWNDFLNESVISVWLELRDLDGINLVNIVFPTIKLTGNKIAPPPLGGVLQAMPFQAIRDASSGTTMSIQRSNTTSLG